MSEEETFIAKPFVYGGRRFINGKLYDAIIPLDDKGQMEKPGHYKAERAMRIVGGIYEGATFSENKARGLTKATWTGSRYAVLGEVEVMRARSDEADIAHKADRLEANAERTSYIEQCMRPVRELIQNAYKRGDHSGALALERAVQRALHKPLTAKEKQ